MISPHLSKKADPPHSTIEWTSPGSRRAEHLLLVLRICGTGFLGIELEEKRNVAHEAVISTAASRVAVRVMHTDEELMIAQTVCRVLGLGGKKGD